MAVKIGHASMSEHGTTTGTAGDNNKKEVCTSSWYLEKRPWVVLRCKDPSKREKIAQAMERAIKNDAIGYDQNQRDTLFNNVKNRGYDPLQTSKNVETDCSALIRVCIAYAYGKDLVGNITTASEPQVLKNTGEFEMLATDKYIKSDAHLLRGDILCTSTTGHTVVILEDGGNEDSDYTASVDNVSNDGLLSFFSINWKDVVVVFLSALLIICGVVMFVLGVKGAVVDKIIKEVQI